MLEEGGGGGGAGCGRPIGAVGLVEDAPQQGDGRHDGVQDGQDARTGFGQVLLVYAHLELGELHTHTCFRYTQTHISLATVCFPDRKSVV